LVVKCVSVGATDTVLFLLPSFLSSYSILPQKFNTLVYFILQPKAGSLQ